MVNDTKILKHIIFLVQAKLAFERLTVERIYHPFICGPNNQITNDLAARTGAKIHVPPQAMAKDEIVVSGEKEGVAVAVNHIMKVYNEKVGMLFNRDNFSTLLKVVN